MCGHKERHILSLLCLDGYVGIISMVNICWRQSTEAPVKRLEFMTVVWREAEDTHAILLARTSLNHGCLVKELLVSHSEA
jgi:hypothetical protein